MWVLLWIGPQSTILTPSTIPSLLPTEEDEPTAGLEVFREPSRRSVFLPIAAVSVLVVLIVAWSQLGASSDTLKTLSMLNEEGDEIEERKGEPVHANTVTRPSHQRKPNEEDTVTPGITNSLRLFFKQRVVAR